MPFRSAYPLRRSAAFRSDDEERAVRRSSHAAVPVALVLLALGLYLGTVSVLFSGLIGLGLLVVGGTLLSTRVNPLSVGFYLTTKPSWTAIGVVFLSSFALFYSTYYYVVHGIGPVIPHLG